MRVIESAKEMSGFSAALKEKGERVAFVPTMGCLHEGHAALMREAKKTGARVVISVFVNPAQFGPGEDYAKYPRDFETDRLLAEREDVDVIFHPPVREIYHDGFSTYVEVEGLSERLCGVLRPGHFRGVATVVARLFGIVRPHVAFFGLKDYQQHLIIRRMASDLGMEVDIVPVETVREADGLAMSSRNRYLSTDQRRAAGVFARALRAGFDAFLRGERRAAAIEGEVKKIVDEEALIVVDYISAVDAETLEPFSSGAVRAPALLAAAVRIGMARLIDNFILR